MPADSVSREILVAPAPRKAQAGRDWRDASVHCGGKASAVAYSIAGATPPELVDRGPDGRRCRARLASRRRHVVQHQLQAVGVQPGAQVSSSAYRRETAARPPAKPAFAAPRAVEKRHLAEQHREVGARRASCLLRFRFRRLVRTPSPGSRAAPPRRPPSPRGDAGRLGDQRLAAGARSASAIAQAYSARRGRRLADEGRAPSCSSPDR